MSRFRMPWTVPGVAVAIILCGLVAGCGGGGGGGTLDPAMAGGWVLNNGLLVITADGQYTMRNADGYWEEGTLEAGGGRFTVRTRDSSDPDMVGDVVSGNYNLAGGILIIDPDDDDPMVFTSLPAGGPVIDRAVGLWQGGGATMAIHRGGYFIFYNADSWRLGNIQVGAGTFTVTVRAGSEAGEIGQGISGTYTLVGNTLTITPAGEAPIVLTLED